MKRTTDKIIEIINTFTPFDEDDFENDNETFLSELTEELLSNPCPEKAINPFLILIEKNSTADLGSPGPIVHFLEKFIGSYEKCLYQSLERKPSLLTIWILNRILNSAEEITTKKDLMERMYNVTLHPLATDNEKEEANEFLRFQHE